jgi:hypothetical protein
MNNNESSFGYGEGPFQTPSEVDFKWSAASIRDRKRKFTWYMGLILISIAVSVAFYFLTHDIITIVILMISVILIAYYGVKKPRKINYTIEGSNLTINDRRYDLNNYKYFVLNDRSHGGDISLIPLKRFSPSINLNFSNQDYDELINNLGNFMPMEQKESDFFDSLLRYIGF